ncbi:MAG: glycosyltransferase [bacterium]|nr:glycosyltransferase [bacterium]
MSDPADLIIGAAIPAYRNVESLRRCLASIIRVSPLLAANISVVDDSGDGRLDAILRSHFPQIRWTIHHENRGFGASANDAVAACTADIVVLLNDDTELLTDPVAPLRQAFCDPRLFAVTFQSVHADLSLREGAKRLIWSLGMPRVLHNPRDQHSAAANEIPSAYAVGGHAAYDRKRFLALGGFDLLFEPFYWEDVDLCWRARSQEWKTVFLPECRVLHDRTGAIRSTFTERMIRETTWRNRLLFAWRHASPVQRVFLELSRIYHHASNPVFRRAYRAARERYRAQTTST